MKLEEHLIESAPGKDIIRSIVRLKKALLKMTSSEASSPEASSSEANFSRGGRALTKYSVRNVQPLSLRMSLQPPSLHRVSYTRQE